MHGESLLMLQDWSPTPEATPTPEAAVDLQPVLLTALNGGEAQNLSAPAGVVATLASAPARVGPARNGVGLKRHGMLEAMPSDADPKDRLGANEPSDSHRGKALRVAAGSALLATGVVLLFIPGPGIPLVAGGLLVLEKDVAWARRLRRRLLAKLQRADRQRSR